MLDGGASPSDDLWTMSGEARRLTVMPVFAAAATLVLSTALIPIGTAWPLPLIGWLITPFATVACLIWGRALYIRLLGDPWFERADGGRKVATLQVLVLVSFLCSIPHAWRIGQQAALWWQ